MTALTVRTASEEDWGVIRTLRLRALQDAPDAFGSTFEEEHLHGEREWRTWVTGWGGAEQVTILAFDDGRPVGLAVGSRREPTDTVVHLFAMWVDPSSRRGGIGRALVEAVVTWARELGARGVELRVTEDNRPAVRLYEETGFAATGERAPLRPGSDIQTITMRRAIPA